MMLEMQITFFVGNRHLVDETAYSPLCCHSTFRRPGGRPFFSAFFAFIIISSSSRSTSSSIIVHNDNNNDVNDNNDTDDKNMNRNNNNNRHLKELTQCHRSNLDSWEPVKCDPRLWERTYSLYHALMMGHE